MADFTDRYCEISGISLPSNGYIRLTLGADWNVVFNSVVAETRHNGGASFAKQNESADTIFASGDFLSILANGAQNSTWNETTLPEGSTCSLRAYGDVSSATNLRLFADQNGENNCPQNVTLIEFLASNGTTVVASFDVSNPSQATTANTEGDGVLTLFGFIFTPPTIDTQPSNQSVSDGQNATFTSEATGAESSQWYENGSPLSGETGSSLSFTASLTDDGNTYFNRYTNSFGDTDTATASLTVSEPAASIDYVDPSLEYGGVVNFIVSNMGPLILWQLSDGTNTIDLLSGDQDSANMPGFVGGTNSLVPGDATLTLSDGSNTLQIETELILPDGYSQVALASGFDTSENGFVDNYDPGAGVGFVFIWPTAEGTLFDDADWILNSSGTMPFYGIDPNDGYMERAFLSWIAPVNVFANGTANADPIAASSQLSNATASSISLATVRAIISLDSESAIAPSSASAQPLIIPIELNNAIAIAESTVSFKSIKRLSPHLRLNSIPIN